MSKIENFLLIPWYLDPTENLSLELFFPNFGVFLRSLAFRGLFRGAAEFFTIFFRLCENIRQESSKNWNFVLISNFVIQAFWFLLASLGIEGGKKFFEYHIYQDSTKTLVKRTSNFKTFLAISGPLGALSVGVEIFYKFSTDSAVNFLEKSASNFHFYSVFVLKRWSSQNFLNLRMKRGRCYTMEELKNTSI